MIDNLPIPPVVCCLMANFASDSINKLVETVSSIVITPMGKLLGLTYLPLAQQTNLGALCGVSEVCAAANGGAGFLLAFGLLSHHPIGVDGN
jgi:hypothetical protein